MNLYESKDPLLFLSQRRYCLRSHLPRLMMVILVIPAIREVMSPRGTAPSLWLDGSSFGWAFSGPTLPCSGSPFFSRFHSLYSSWTLRIPTEGPKFADLEPGFHGHLGRCLLEALPLRRWCHGQARRMSNPLLQPGSLVVPMPTDSHSRLGGQGFHILLGILPLNTPG